MAELQQRDPARTRPRRLRASLLGTAAALGVATGALVYAQQPALGQATAPVSAGLANLAVEDGYADLAEAVMPAVVNVRVERAAASGATEGRPDGRPAPFEDPEMRRFFERFFGEPGQGGPGRPGGPGGQGPQPQPRRQMGEGSGFVISPDGLIVTNAHVAGGADKVEVLFKDGRRLDATVKGVDEKTDLALLKVEAGQPLPFVAFGDSSKVRPGDKVVAVGNPFGLGGTVTAGIVSATGREIGSGPYDDFLQIDAPINRGNSGGPTFNLRGEVVGVNTAIFSPSGGSVGIGFAIAANLAKQVVADLQDDGKVERGWLGVGIQGLDQDLATALKLDGEPRGALVSRVEDGSPAAKAGIRRGDVILEFGGQAIDRVGQLSRAVAAVPSGTAADVAVWRDGKREMLKAQVGAMPTRDEVAAVAPRDEEAEQPRLGLGLAAITPEARARLNLEGDVEGVLVTQVAPESPADAKGIEPGDIVMSVDQKPVTEPRQLVDAVRQASSTGAKSVLLLVMRDGQQRYEAVPLAVS